MRGARSSIVLALLPVWLFLAPGQALAETFVNPMKLGGSEYCRHCHTDISHQLNASAHHFSSFNNPVCRKLATQVLEKKGAEAFKFCARCHDPVLSSSGLSDKPDADSWQANAGIYLPVAP